MSLTSENYFRTKDPLFGSRESGVIAAQTRLDRLTVGFSLGDVVRAESGIPLPAFEEPTHAPADEELSHEVGITRSTVMRNIITGETRTLGEIQDTPAMGSEATVLPYEARTAGGLAVAASVENHDVA